MVQQNDEATSGEPGHSPRSPGQQRPHRPHPTPTSVHASTLRIGTAMDYDRSELEMEMERSRAAHAEELAAAEHGRVQVGGSAAAAPRGSDHHLRTPSAP